MNGFIVFASLLVIAYGATYYPNTYGNAYSGSQYPYGSQQYAYQYPSSASYGYGQQGMYNQGMGRNMYDQSREQMAETQCSRYCTSGMTSSSSSVNTCCRQQGYQRGSCSGTRANCDD